MFMLTVTRTQKYCKSFLTNLVFFILWSDLQKTIRLHTSSGMNLGEMSVEVKGAMN